MAFVPVRTAIYKGKKYKLNWSGQTRYGHRACLEFFGNSPKSFWVDSSLVQVLETHQVQAMEEEKEEREAIQSEPVGPVDTFDDIPF